MHPLAAVTLGAGVQWHEAYDAIEVYDLLVVGEHSIGGSVGAAGLIEALGNALDAEFKSFYQQSCPTYPYESRFRPPANLLML